MIQTTDRAPDGEPRERFYAPVKLGAVQSLTPEGFLVCEAVPIARTGELLYVAGELGTVKAGRDGIITVSRDANSLFAPAFLASLEGKPVTLGHKWVSPANFQAVTAGTMQNVRRGEGEQADVVLADLVIMDAVAINEVRGGLRDVSLGYDADYAQTEPGQAVQFLTKGNHLALVRSGRCGPSCSIGDEDMTKKTGSLASRIRAAFRTRDEAALTEILGEEGATKDEGEVVAGGEEHKVVIEVRQAAAEPAATEEPAKDEEPAVDPIAALTEVVTKLVDRVTALEAASAKPAEKTGDEDPEAEPEKKTEDEAGDDEEDKGERTTDSAGLATVFQDTLARAEILAPGISLPAFSAQASAKATRELVAGLHRTALEAAYATEDGKEAIHTFDAAPDFKAMTTDSARLLFMAASERVKAANNGRLRTTQATRDKSRVPVRTPAEMNAANRAHYGRTA